MNPWTSRAACTGLDPSWWFPGVITPDEAAAWTEAGIPTAPRSATTDTRGLRVCAGCPVAFECALAALERGEQAGTWGGLGADGILKAIRRTLHNAGPTAAAAEIRREQADLRARFDAGGPRPWQPRRECPRCGAPVPAGRHPTDRNPPGATCGLRATAVKGCRCLPCIRADHDRQLRQRQPGLD